MPRRTNHHKAACGKPAAGKKTKLCETAAPGTDAVRKKAIHNLRSCTHKKALKAQLDQGVSLLIAKTAASEIAKDAIRDFP